MNRPAFYLFAIFCLLGSLNAFAKLEVGDCAQSLVNYGDQHPSVTQVGRMEIFYNDGTTTLSSYFVAEGELGRVPEKEINDFVSSLKSSRDRIDHVMLHLYFPASQGHVSQIIKLKN